jgi:hypothetical protein
VIARVQGISSLAEAIGMTRQGLQKALAAKGAADSLICCQPRSDDALWSS